MAVSEESGRFKVCMYYAGIITFGHSYQREETFMDLEQADEEGIRDAIRRNTKACLFTVILPFQ